MVRRTQPRAHPLKIGGPKHIIRMTNEIKVWSAEIEGPRPSIPKPQSPVWCLFKTLLKKWPNLLISQADREVVTRWNSILYKAKMIMKQIKLIYCQREPKMWSVKLTRIVLWENFHLLSFLKNKRSILQEHRNLLTLSLIRVTALKSMFLSKPKLLNKHRIHGTLSRYRKLKAKR